MKKFLLALGCLAAVATTPALAGDADFTLVNRTGYSIREVYISAANRNSWGNDRLGDGTLENGRSKLFKFSDRAACKQDLMVVFDDDGSKVTWEDFDLCEINKITIKYNRGSRTVSADIE
ncbi:MAG TPA: hypothetical protein VEA35_04285 [Ramlibacter sp.]|nr:hypothetical protein [Aquabacterium sp.]HYF41647.1 hypothetical protein [Ramlibacter sp.]